MPSCRRRAIAGSRPDASASSRPAAAIADFLSHVFYQRSDFTTPEGMKGLAERLHSLEPERKLPGNRLFYLATDPEFFRPIVEGLAGAGLIR